jgi:hypothetical protein
VSKGFDVVILRSAWRVAAALRWHPGFLAPSALAWLGAASQREHFVSLSAAGA